MKQAATQLDDAKQKLDTLRQTAANRPLTEPEKLQAADARNEISRAAQTLQNAAGKSSDSTLASGRHAPEEEIADQPMKQADENTAAGQLASDQPDARDKKFDAASQNIADARSKLDQLAQEIDNKAKDQPLARELQRIAAEQKKLADELAQHPNDPKLLARQKQLQQELENVIKQHPELERPAAEAAKGDTQDVQKKLDDLAAQQKQFNDQARAQQDATVAQDKLNDLAKRQEDLNKQIKDFNSQHPDALRQADATRTPSPAQLDSIPKDLRNRNLPSAAQGQAATTNQLDQTAQQLENSPHREETGNGGIRNASDLQAQAAKLKQDIEDAVPPPTPRNNSSISAQQPAPAYRDAIKNYYSRIAKLEQQPEGDMNNRKSKIENRKFLLLCALCLSKPRTNVSPRRRLHHRTHPPQVISAVDRGLEWLAAHQDARTGPARRPRRQRPRRRHHLPLRHGLMARGHVPGQGPAWRHPQPRRRQRPRRPTQPDGALSLAEPPGPRLRPCTTTASPPSCSAKPTACSTRRQASVPRPPSPRPCASSFSPRRVPKDPGLPGRVGATRPPPLIPTSPSPATLHHVPHFLDGRSPPRAYVRVIGKVHPPLAVARIFRPRWPQCFSPSAAPCRSAIAG